MSEPVLKAWPEVRCNIKNSEYIDYSVPDHGYYGEDPELALVGGL